MLLVLYGNNCMKLLCSSNPATVLYYFRHQKCRARIKQQFILFAVQELTSFNLSKSFRLFFVLTVSEEFPIPTKPNKGQTKSVILSFDFSAPKLYLASVWRWTVEHRRVFQNSLCLNASTY